MKLLTTIVYFGLLLTTNLMAQGGPPPPANPLQPPVDPIGNVSSFDKIMLGKALYWDEQLSSTKTVACASCHIMSNGGTDPRANATNPSAINPGFDKLFLTNDDIVGSPGVVDSCKNGEYRFNQIYGYNQQVTGRKAPSVINAGYASNLFWDGRALEQLIDPISNEIILTSGAALESQILGPPTSSIEMAHTGRSWKDVIRSVEAASPLALSSDSSIEMQGWIGTQNYFQLFQLVFGESAITASKIAMAIACYERSLFSNQSPFDANLQGDPGAMSNQQRRGLGVFRREMCGGCHTGALLSDNNFHNIGVTPNAEDEGRFAVTGVNADRGRYKTPPLRNLANRGSFMHNGAFTTIEEVVDFYDRGGDFNNPNLDPRMVPLNLNQNDKSDLVVFLRDALTDTRVTNETGPFASPLLFSESNRVPVINGSGIAGTDEKEPKIIAIEPPLLGNSSFTIAIENAKANSESFLVVNTQDPGLEGLPNEEESVYFLSKPLLDEHASVSVSLPNQDKHIGTSLFARWYIEDSQAENGYAVSPLLEFTLFKPSYGSTGQLFNADFEERTSHCE